MNDWATRHRITTLLARCYPDPRRLAAFAAQQGQDLTPPRGFEPIFVAASQLVLATDDLEALVRAAAETHEEFAALLPRDRKAPPAKEPAAVQPAAAEPAAKAPATEAPASDPTEKTTVAASSVEAASDALPRPAGTPARAPAPETAETWVARHVGWEAPPSLTPGEPCPIVVRFTAPAGEAVGGAPAGHTPYVGESFPVQCELALEGATPPTLHQTVRLDPVDRESQVVFSVIPEVGAERVDLVLRCYSGGYQVGQGRFVGVVPTGERQAGGALAVPDSVLESVNEDAIKTVMGEVETIKG